MAYLFGADDRKLKHDVKTVNWQKVGEKFQYVKSHVNPTGRTLERVLRMASMALQGSKGPKKLIEIRCERGAEIARHLGFPEMTAQAILDLDEHWNGQGHPHGLRGEQISLLGRILCISQSIEVFWRSEGMASALEMAKDRKGTWFEPALVDLFVELAKEPKFLADLSQADPDMVLSDMQPMDTQLGPNEAMLDRIATAFSEVVDAKSPWTFRHSLNVANISVGMAEQLGLPADERRAFRRIALLHDIGKLGVSNLILDKPGKLTEDEFSAMKQHSRMSEEILSKVSAFSQHATIAGAHHERFDGQGYFRGIASSQLPITARILMVADVFEAMTANRPYRPGHAPEKVWEMLSRDVGTAVCPIALDGLRRWMDANAFQSRIEAQLESLDKLQSELSDCCSGTC